MPKQNDWHKNHNKTKQSRNNRILEPKGDHCTHVTFGMAGCFRWGGDIWVVLEGPESFLLQYRAFCVRCVFTW